MSLSTQLTILISSLLVAISAATVAESSGTSTAVTTTKFSYPSDYELSLSTTNGITYICDDSKQCAPYSQFIQVYQSEFGNDEYTDYLRTGETIEAMSDSRLIGGNTGIPSDVLVSAFSHASAAAAVTGTSGQVLYIDNKSNSSNINSATSYHYSNTSESVVGSTFSSNGSIDSVTASSRGEANGSLDRSNWATGIFGLAVVAMMTLMM